MGSGLFKNVMGNRFGLARGEKFVAATGLGFVTTLIVAFGVMGWMTIRSIEQGNAQLIETNAKQLTSILASQAELRLQEGDLSGLRRLILDAASSGGVEHCSVVVPGVGIIASTTVSEIDIQSLDEIKASGIGSERLVRVLENGRVEVHEPLRVGEQHLMVLQIATSPSSTGSVAGYVQTILVVVGASGLVLMLWIYRRFRTKLGGISAVGESLIDFHKGERRVECLRVGDMLGTEAQAFNQMLIEREAVENESVDREIRECFATHGGDGVGLREACSTITQGLMIVDAALLVQYSNGAACSFLGHDGTHTDGWMLEGQGIEQELIDAVHQVLDGSSGTRLVVETGDLTQVSGGSTVLKIVITQIADGDDQRVILVIEDITQQRISDESRNTLMAQATHELRTPLTNIRLYVEEAIEAGSEDEAMRETALNVINKESRRLERVISDMMSVSEIEAGSLSIRMGDLRIGDLVSGLELDYKAQAKEKSIELSFNLPPKMPVLQADRDRVEQALHNLIGNAMKYTPEGGKVAVRFAFDDDDSMRVEVVDTGIGIDPDECAKIFEKFYRADDRRVSDVTGSGLGLALAREIARLHGGDITVESEIDHGSTFTLTIPSGTESMNQAA
ncbi:MAG: hypothetical protein JKY96_03615 [Phycisphaerales bacterium]|nr:hypothetical protein [Phycisphaerales bacterium]